MRWFGRIADVPGTDYAALEPIDGSSLPSHNARPGQFGMWPTAQGSTSISPARAWMDAVDQDSRPEAVRRRAAEALELPGSLPDYSLILSSAIGSLWNLRAQAGWIPGAIEQLCRLQLRLATIYAGNPDDYGDSPFDAPRPNGAFTLVDLYAREGFLEEAISVAEEAIRLGLPVPQVEKLRSRLENARSEHAS